MFLIWLLLAVVIIVMLTSYICYHIVFYAKPAPPLPEGEFDIPPGKVYLPYRDQMITWQKQVRQLPVEHFSITAFDGIPLHGKFYEFAPGAVIELMFHGYRGSAERDLCGGVQRAFSLGRSVLLVDQRTAGKSGGHTITFGINEHQDCLAWVDFAVKHFGPEIKLILTGISMGAATVVIASGCDLPENVVGILADCGYSSAKEIIYKCSRDMKLPPKLMYPFIKLGARLFGHFDLDETSPIEAVKRCKKPIIFFHGEEDGFVPCYMSQMVYEACTSPKRIVTMTGADHGMCFLADPDGYLKNVAEFFTENGTITTVL